MSIRKIIEWDKRNLERLKKFQLPHTYKSVGWILALIAFCGLLFFKFSEVELAWSKPLIRNLMLIGLLLVSVSKERVEDEMIRMIRMQSYALAFVLGVLYSVVQPLVNLAVFTLLGSENTGWEISYYQVMTFMLMVQLMFFYVMLNKCRS